MSEPFTQAEIVTALGQIQEEVGAYFAGLAPGQFMHGNAETWSPAHHLHHLIVSNAPVGRALGLPRDRLPARVATQPSRSYPEMQALYQETLATGVKASGRFLPDPQGNQAELVAGYRQTLDALQVQVQGWNDADLDTYSLAHPVLGLLSVREMLLFTLYHNAHHRAGVQNKTNMENA